MNYFFSGEDEYRKDLSVESLKKKLFKCGVDALNFEIYNGKVNRVEEFICSMDTLSLTCEKKLVLLKEPELLVEEDREILISFLKRSSSSNHVLVIISNKLGGSKDKLGPLLRKYCNSKEIISQNI